MGTFTAYEMKRLGYEKPLIEKGYANRTLYVNLSDQDIAIKPVTGTMKEVFVGGKGFDLCLLSDVEKWGARWNDPENAICIASGPLGGTPIYPGSGKSIVTAISATTGSVMDSNVGGYFGPYLKFSGFDALEIQGKSKVPAIIFIDGIEEQVQILEAAGLPEGAHEISALLTDYFGRESRGISPS